MPQPDSSSSARSVVCLVLTALVIVAAAALATWAGGTLSMIAGIVALAALVPLVLLFLAVRAAMDDAVAARIAVEAQQRENERNQNAILRLLDEIAGLGQGDLTATATVTEDITGAIADSVNIAVESLRDLVTT